MSQQKWISSKPGLHIVGCNQAITRSGSYWLLILHTVNTSKHQFHHCKEAICLNEASSQPVKPSWHSHVAQNAANPLLDSHINISQWLHRIPITLVNTAQPAYFINGGCRKSWTELSLKYCAAVLYHTNVHWTPVQWENTHIYQRCPQRIHPTLKYYCSAIVNIFFPPPPQAFQAIPLSTPSPLRLLMWL